MNKRQTNKVFYNYRVKGPRGNRGPGHRFNTINKAFSKKLSMLQRRYGIAEGFRLMCMFDGLDPAFAQREATHD